MMKKRQLQVVQQLLKEEEAGEEAREETEKVEMTRRYFNDYNIVTFMQSSFDKRLCVKSEDEVVSTHSKRKNRRGNDSVHGI